MPSHEGDLAALRSRGRLRTLTPRQGADFTSNDYLGLAQSDELRTAAMAALTRHVPAGSGGSRLLRGNHEEHEALEAEAAAFFGAEAALFFPGGFAANSALVATLPQRGDLVVHDALVHASVRQGLRLTRAEAIEAPHGDVTAIDDALRRWRVQGGRGRAWIAAETLYSMDGDFAPVEDLVAVADRHEAILLLDEAHATGVHGLSGRGLAAQYEGRPNIITLHTCGKALGVMGGLVCLPRVLRDYMVNRARGFIYATAPSPLVAALVREALRLVAHADDRRQRLQGLITHARRGLSAIGVTATRSQIQPVIVGGDECATAIAAGLQKHGFDVRAIRPPTVPEGTARLRIALTLNVSEAMLDALIAALGRELARSAA